MPAYYWLDRPLDKRWIADKMRALRHVGVPYTDEEIAGAEKTLEDKTELDALIAYLQNLGTTIKQVR